MTPGSMRVFYIPGEGLPAATAPVSLLLGLLCVGGAVELHLHRGPPEPATSLGEAIASSDAERRPKSGRGDAERPAPAAPALCPPLFSVPFPAGQAQAPVPPQPLAELTGWLLRHPEVSLQLDGYADGAGPRERSLELSQRRAAWVAQRFVARGIGPERLLLRGFGYDATLGAAWLMAQRRVRLSVPGQSLGDNKGRCPAEVP